MCTDRTLELRPCDYSLPYQRCSSSALLTAQVSEFRMFAAPRLRFLAVNSRRQPRIGMSSPRSRAASRLIQVSNHLDAKKPFLELNTPFSTERSARIEDEQGNRILPKKTEPPKPQVKPVQPAEAVKQEAKEIKETPEPPQKMSSQPPHPALLIPGPIEFDDAVLNSIDRKSTRLNSSHSGESRMPSSA